MAVIMLFYVVLGCVMDEMSMILLTIPIFFPLIMALDFGLKPDETAIWFGILVLMVVEIGLIAPPVGLNVYVVNGMDKRTPIAESYRGVVPFLITDFIRLAQPDALFIDCRSEAEYFFVGHPEGAVHVSWAEAPDWDINPHFVAEVRKLVSQSIDRPVVIICRSGNRSVDAGEGPRRRRASRG
jgi:rhodanese-related sulfurtransferase